MQVSTVKFHINGKSLAAFAVLIIFSFGMAWLVLSKTDDAIKDFEKINNSRSEMIKKNLEENRLPSSTGNF